MPNIRREMPDVSLTQDEFKRRFRQRFYDPAFAPLQEEIERLADVAWDGYDSYRKAPRTERAGPGFADPDYELSIEWRAASQEVQDAEQRQKDPSPPPRILLINGATRSEHTCPGETSKTWRLAMIAYETFARERISRWKSWTSAGWHRNTVARSIPARPASRPRCRSATGRVPATRTTPWDRSATG